MIRHVPACIAQAQPFFDQAGVRCRAALLCSFTAPARGAPLGSGPLRQPHAPQSSPRRSGRCVHTPRLANLVHRDDCEQSLDRAVRHRRISGTPRESSGTLRLLDHLACIRGSSALLRLHKSAERLCELNVPERFMNISSIDSVNDAWRRRDLLPMHELIFPLENGRLRELGRSATDSMLACETCVAVIGDSVSP